MKWLGIVLAIVAIMFLFWQRTPEKAVPLRPEEETKEVGETKALRSVTLITENPFILEYGQDDLDTENDLSVLRLLLRDSQLTIKNFDTYFLPENREIIAFLQGNNRDRLAWIPRKHRFLNEEGELIDRWGTPVFFHRLSGFDYELRSAGPDGKHWTSDDISTGAKSTK